jgi:hypothetical protein
VKARFSIPISIAAGLLIAAAVAPSAWAGTVTYSPSSLTFGSQKEGTASAYQSVTITVTDGAAFTRADGQIFTGQDPTDFGVLNGDCPRDLIPPFMGTTSCTFQVGFTPTGGGPRSALLEYGYAGGDAPDLAPIPLSGNGIGATKGKKKKCKKAKKGASAAKKACKKKKRK